MMNKTAKKKLFKDYAIQTGFHTMPNGEKLPITELSAAAQAGYIDVKDGTDDDRINYIIIHGFDDFDESDVGDLSMMKSSIRQGMMVSVLKLSGMLSEEQGEEKKP